MFQIAIVALGITVAGGVFLDANPTTHASEIKKQVEAAEAKLIVTNGPNYEKVTILDRKFNGVTAKNSKA